MTSPTPEGQRVAGSYAFMHKGYTGSAEPDDAGWHGRLLGISDVVTYSADTLPSLASSFLAAVDDYLQTCAELGDTPCPPTTSGREGERG